MHWFILIELLSNSWKTKINITVFQRDILEYILFTTFVNFFHTQQNLF